MLSRMEIYVTLYEMVILYQICIKTRLRVLNESLYRKVSDNMGKKRKIDAEYTAQKAKKGLLGIIFSRAGIILLLI